MSIECIALHDPNSGATARILAGFGFNCFEFRVPHRGSEVDLLWSAEGFDGGGERPSGSGIPLLFPFPGRIAGTTLKWEGREYPLAGDDGRGNAIHGFVLDRPWRVIEAAENYVVGQFQASVDDPQLLACWPADFQITVRYELQGTTLTSLLRIDNPDDKPLPCGLGTHPYFKVPLGGTSPHGVDVQLPVSRHWELVEMNPSGKCTVVADASELQAGRPFASMQYDDVFAGLKFDDDGLCRARVRDAESGLTLQLEFDRSFRECVVYVPPHREAICIEPYTCVPNAAALQARGIDSGLRILAPGESFEAQVVMRVLAGD